MNIKNVAFIGFCYAGSIIEAARKIQETENVYGDIRLFCHFAMGVWFFRPESFRYMYTHDSERKNFLMAPPEKAPDDFPPEAGFFAWHLERTSKNKSTVPAPEDLRRDWVYCVAGLMCPLFPPYSRTKLHYDLINSIAAGEVEPSVNFIADHYLNQHKPVLDFMVLLKNAGLNVMALEPNRVLPIDGLPVEIYKKTIGIERAITRMALKQYGVPVLELRPDLIDENGFTPERYRGPDLVHGNDDFHAIAARDMLKFIDANYKFTGEGGRLRYDP